MPARPHAFAARFPPPGWADLGRGLLLFGVAYHAYRLVDGRAARAFANAREIIHFEQSLRNIFMAAAWATSQLVRAAPHAWAFQTRHGGATA